MRSKKPLSLIDMWEKINDLLAKTKQDSFWNVGKNEKFECVIVYKPSAEEEIPLLHEIKDIIRPMNHEKHFSPLETEITGWDGDQIEMLREDNQGPGEILTQQNNHNLNASATEITQEEQAELESLFQLSNDIKFNVGDVKIFDAEKDKKRDSYINIADIDNDNADETQPSGFENNINDAEENREVDNSPSDNQMNILSKRKAKTTKATSKTNKRVKKSPSQIPKKTISQSRSNVKASENSDGLVTKVKKPPGRRPVLWPVLETNEQGRYLCPISSCGKHYSQKTGAWGHYRQCHTQPQNMIKCTKCPMQFTAQFELKFHEDLVHKLNDGHLVCSTCGMRFQQQSSLNYHETRFHPPPEEAAANDKEYVVKKGASKCFFCKKSFSKLLYKHLHLFEAHKDQLWHCSICTQPFTAEKGLLKHTRKIHQIEPVIHDCKYCKKTFTNEKEHSYHMDKVHPEEDLDVVKDFVCSIATCQKRFRSSMNLDLHFKTHKSNDQRLRIMKQAKQKANTSLTPKEEKIPCETCGTLISKRNMKIHCLIHADTKQYACNLCDKTFHMKQYLVQHKLDVHIRRELVCPVETCRKVFYNNKVLYHHMDMHSGVKQKCPHCDKEFVYRSDLRTHIRGVHEGHKSYCSFCQKEFSRGSEKNRHERKYHHAKTSEQAM